MVSFLYYLEIKEYVNLYNGFFFKGFFFFKILFVCVRRGRGDGVKSQKLKIRIFFSKKFKRIFIKVFFFIVYIMLIMWLHTGVLGITCSKNIAQLFITQKCDRMSCSQFFLPFHLVLKFFKNIFLNQWLNNILGLNFN